MPRELPSEFRSEEELADWFESADLATYTMREALDVVVVSQLSLSVEPPVESGAHTSGQTGTTTKYELIRA